MDKSKTKSRLGITTLKAPTNSANGATGGGGGGSMIAMRTPPPLQSNMTTSTNTALCAARARAAVRAAGVRGATSEDAASTAHHSQQATRGLADPHPSAPEGGLSIRGELFLVSPAAGLHLKPHSVLTSLHADKDGGSIAIPNWVVCDDKRISVYTSFSHQSTLLEEVSFDRVTLLFNFTASQDSAGVASSNEGGGHRSAHGGGDHRSAAGRSIASRVERNVYGRTLSSPAHILGSYDDDRLTAASGHRSTSHHASPSHYGGAGAAHTVHAKQHFFGVDFIQLVPTTNEQGHEVVAHQHRLLIFSSPLMDDYLEWLAFFDTLSALTNAFGGPALHRTKAHDEDMTTHEGQQPTTPQEVDLRGAVSGSRNYDPWGAKFVGDPLPPDFDLSATKKFVQQLPTAMEPLPDQTELRTALDEAERWAAEYRTMSAHYIATVQEHEEWLRASMEDAQEAARAMLLAVFSMQTLDVCSTLPHYGRMSGRSSAFATPLGTPGKPQQARPSPGIRYLSGGDSPRPLQLTNDSFTSQPAVPYAATLDALRTQLQAFAEDHDSATLSLQTAVSSYQDEICLLREQIIQLEVGVLGTVSAIRGTTNDGASFASGDQRFRSTEVHDVSQALSHVVDLVLVTSGIVHGRRAPDQKKSLKHNRRKAHRRRRVDDAPLVMERGGTTEVVLTPLAPWEVQSDAASDIPAIATPTSPTSTAVLVDVPPSLRRDPLENGSEDGDEKGSEDDVGAETHHREYSDGSDEEDVDASSGEDAENQPLVDVRIDTGVVASLRLQSADLTAYVRALENHRDQLQGQLSTNERNLVSIRDTLHTSFRTAKNNWESTIATLEGQLNNEHHVVARLTAALHAHVDRANQQDHVIETLQSALAAIEEGDSDLAASSMLVTTTNSDMAGSGLQPQQPPIDSPPQTTRQDAPNVADMSFDVSANGAQLASLLSTNDRGADNDGFQTPAALAVLGASNHELERFGGGAQRTTGTAADKPDSQPSATADKVDRSPIDALMSEGFLSPRSSKLASGFRRIGSHRKQQPRTPRTPTAPSFKPATARLHPHQQHQPHQLPSKQLRKRFQRALEALNHAALTHHHNHSGEDGGIPVVHSDVDETDSHHATPLPGVVLPLGLAEHHDAETLTDEPAVTALPATVVPTPRNATDSHSDTLPQDTVARASESLAEALREMESASQQQAQRAQSRVSQLQEALRKERSQNHAIGKLLHDVVNAMQSKESELHQRVSDLNGNLASSPIPVPLVTHGGAGLSADELLNPYVVNGVLSSTHEGAMREVCFHYTLLGEVNEALEKTVGLAEREIDIQNTKKANELRHLQQVKERVEQEMRSALRAADEEREAARKNMEIAEEQWRLKETELNDQQRVAQERALLEGIAEERQRQELEIQKKAAAAQKALENERSRLQLEKDAALRELHTLAQHQLDAKSKEMEHQSLALIRQREDMLRTVVEDATMQMAEKDEQLQEHTTRLSQELAAREKDHEAKLAAQREVVESIERELARSRDAHQALSSTVASLNDDLEEARGRAAAAEESHVQALHQLHAHHESLETQIRDLSARNEADSQSLKTKIRALKNERNALADEVRQLKDQMKLVEDDLTLRSKQREQEYNALKARREQQVAELQATMAKIAQQRDEEADELHRKVEELEAAKAERERKAGSLERTVSELSDRIKERDSALESVGSELEEDRRLLHHTVSNLNAEIQTLAQVRASAESSREEELTRLQGQHAETLKQMESTWLSEETRRNANVDDMRAKIRDIIAERDSLSKEVRSLKDELQILEDDINQKQKQREQEQLELKMKRERQMFEMQQAMATMKKERDDEAEELLRKVQELEIAKADREMRAGSLERKVTELSDRIKERDSALESVGTELEQDRSTMKRTVSTLNTEIETLAKARAAAEAKREEEFKRLQNQHASTIQEIDATRAAEEERRTADVEGMRRKVRDIIGERDSLLREVRSLKDELRALEDDINQKQKRREQEQLELKLRRERQLSEMQEALAKMSLDRDAEAEELHKKIQELEFAKVERDMRAGTLERKVSELSDRIKERDATIESVGSELELDRSTLKRTVSNLSSEIDSLAKARAAAESQREEELSKLQYQHSMTLQEIEALRIAEEERRSADVEGMRMKVRELIAERDTYAKRVRDYESSLKLADESKRALVDQNEHLERTLQNHLRVGDEERGLREQRSRVGTDVMESLRTKYLAALTERDKVGDACRHMSEFLLQLRCVAEEISSQLALGASTSTSPLVGEGSSYPSITDASAAQAPAVQGEDQDPFSPAAVSALVETCKVHHERTLDWIRKAKGRASQEKKTIGRLQQEVQDLTKTKSDLQQSLQAKELALDALRAQSLQQTASLQQAITHRDDLIEGLKTESNQTTRTFQNRLVEQDEQHRQWQRAAHEAQGRALSSLLVSCEQRAREMFLTNAQEQAWSVFDGAMLQTLVHNTRTVLAPSMWGMCLEELLEPLVVHHLDLQTHYHRSIVEALVLLGAPPTVSGDNLADTRSSSCGSSKAPSSVDPLDSREIFSEFATATLIDTLLKQCYIARHALDEISGIVVPTIVTQSGNFDNSATGPESEDGGDRGGRGAMHMTDVVVSTAESTRVLLASSSGEAQSQKPTPGRGRRLSLKQGSEWAARRRQQQQSSPPRLQEYRAFMDSFGDMSSPLVIEADRESGDPETSDGGDVVVLDSSVVHANPEETITALRERLRLLETVLAEQRLVRATLSEALGMDPPSFVEQQHFSSPMIVLEDVDSGPEEAHGLPLNASFERGPMDGLSSGEFKRDPLVLGSSESFSGVVTSISSANHLREPTPVDTPCSNDSITAAGNSTRRRSVGPKGKPPSVVMASKQPLGASLNVAKTSTNSTTTTNSMLAVTGTAAEEAAGEGQRSLRRISFADDNNSPTAQQQSGGVPPLAPVAQAQARQDEPLLDVRLPPALDQEVSPPSVHNGNDLSISGDFHTISGMSLMVAESLRLRDQQVRQLSKAVHCCLKLLSEESIEAIKDASKAYFDPAAPPPTDVELLELVAGASDSSGSPYDSLNHNHNHSGHKEHSRSKLKPKKSTDTLVDVTVTITVPKLVNQCQHVAEIVSQLRALVDKDDLHLTSYENMLAEAGGDELLPTNSEVPPHSHVGDGSERNPSLDLEELTRAAVDADGLVFESDASVQGSRDGVGSTSSPQAPTPHYASPQKQILADALRRSCTSVRSRRTSVVQLFTRSLDDILDSVETKFDELQRLREEHGNVINELQHLLQHEDEGETSLEASHERHPHSGEVDNSATSSGIFVPVRDVRGDVSPDDALDVLAIDRDDAPHHPRLETKASTVRLPKTVLQDVTSDDDKFSSTVLLSGTFSGTRRGPKKKPGAVVVVSSPHTESLAVTKTIQSSDSFDANRLSQPAPPVAIAKATLRGKVSPGNRISPSVKGPDLVSVVRRQLEKQVGEVHQLRTAIRTGIEHLGGESVPETDSSDDNGGAGASIRPPALSTALLSICRETGDSIQVVRSLLSPDGDGGKLRLSDLVIGIKQKVDELEDVKEHSKALAEEVRATMEDSVMDSSTGSSGGFGGPRVQRKAKPRRVSLAASASDSTLNSTMGSLRKTIDAIPMTRAQTVHIVEPISSSPHLAPTSNTADFRQRVNALPPPLAPRQPTPSHESASKATTPVTMTPGLPKPPNPMEELRGELKGRLSEVKELKHALKSSLEVLHEGMGVTTSLHTRGGHSDTTPRAEALYQAAVLASAEILSSRKALQQVESLLPLPALQPVAAAGGNTTPRRNGDDGGNAMRLTTSASLPPEGNNNEEGLEGSQRQTTTELMLHSHSLQAMVESLVSEFKRLRGEAATLQIQVEAQQRQRVFLLQQSDEELAKMQTEWKAVTENLTTMTIERDARDTFIETLSAWTSDCFTTLLDEGFDEVQGMSDAAQDAAQLVLNSVIAATREDLSRSCDDFQKTFAELSIASRDLESTTDALKETKVGVAQAEQHLAESQDALHAMELELRAAQASLTAAQEDIAHSEHARLDAQLAAQQEKQAHLDSLHSLLGLLAPSSNTNSTTTTSTSTTLEVVQSLITTHLEDIDRLKDDVAEKDREAVLCTQLMGRSLTELQNSSMFSHAARERLPDVCEATIRFMLDLQDSLNAAHATIHSLRGPSEQMEKLMDAWDEVQRKLVEPALRWWKEESEGFAAKDNSRDRSRGVALIASPPRYRTATEAIAGSAAALLSFTTTPSSSSEAPSEVDVVSGILSELMYQHRARRHLDEEVTRVRRILEEALHRYDRYLGGAGPAVSSMSRPSSQNSSFSHQSQFAADMTDRMTVNELAASVTAILETTTHQCRALGTEWQTAHSALHDAQSRLEVVERTYQQDLAAVEVKVSELRRHVEDKRRADVVTEHHVYEVEQSLGHHSAELQQLTLERSQVSDHIYHIRSLLQQRRAWDDETNMLIHDLHPKSF